MKALWSGSLVLGPLMIPIKLYNAVKESPLHFKLLEKQTLCPISYARICRTTGKEVAAKDIVRGYEYKKGEYVVLSPEDLRRFHPERTKTLTILHFIDEGVVPPPFYDRPTYIAPVKHAEKAYALLCATLCKEHKVALASVVLKDREYLGVVHAEKQALLFEQLRYNSELQSPEQLHLKLPTTVEPTASEARIMSELVNTLSGPFQPERYEDTYTKELCALIKARVAGKKLQLEEQTIATHNARVQELFDALKGQLTPLKKDQKTRSRSFSRSARRSSLFPHGQID